MADETAAVLSSDENGAYAPVHSRSSAFYDLYERKADLKHQTHYCPGCGHGVAHKLIAEALEDLKLQDQAIFVGPVGCSVFAYYYFDVGHVQVAHGRAPAAATGIKRACKDKIVIAYQGDGDLAAIGTAEIVHAANRGENVTVFFLNNGIYGMTGGQMAPTTLVGERSTTSPWGRRPSNEGYPLHMAELLATLEAPAYIERVALCDSKNIMRARRAVRHALEVQRAGLGFSFVEILSPCPTIWGKEPVDARRWVLEKMVPAFPLNTFRDRKEPLAATNAPPRKTVAEVIGSASVTSTSCTETKCSRRVKNLSVNIAGFGGQGVLLLGQLLAEVGMREGYEVSWLPSYGPEMRSGSAHCYLSFASDRIGSPLAHHPNVLIAMNEISLRKFAHDVAPGGLILYNRETLPEDLVVPDLRVLCIPASETADKLGAAKAANIVMMGAMLEETEFLSFQTTLTVLQDKVKKVELLEIDRTALAAGRHFADQMAHLGGVTQPDGFAD